MIALAVALTFSSTTPSAPSTRGRLQALLHLLGFQLAELGHRRHLTEGAAHDPFELSGDRHLAGDVERSVDCVTRRAEHLVQQVLFLVGPLQQPEHVPLRLRREVHRFADEVRVGRVGLLHAPHRVAHHFLGVEIPARAHLRVDEVLEFGRKRDLHRVLLVGRGRDAAPMG